MFFWFFWLQVGFSLGSFLQLQDGKMMPVRHSSAPFGFLRGSCAQKRLQQNSREVPGSIPATSGGAGRQRGRRGWTGRQTKIPQSTDFLLNLSSLVLATLGLFFEIPPLEAHVGEKGLYSGHGSLTSPKGLTFFSFRDVALTLDCHPSLSCTLARAHTSDTSTTFMCLTGSVKHLATGRAPVSHAPHRCR